MKSKDDNEELQELSADELDGVTGAGRDLGTYATVSRSYGVYSVSTTTYTDNQGNQFQAVTTGWGLSLPGFGASGGHVYAWDSAPANTTIRDVALGPSTSGGVLDNTSMNKSGYTLETIGTLNVSLERTNTTEIPGTATGPASAPAHDAPPQGDHTQTFDDGSTLTTHADGTTTATDAPHDAPQGDHTQTFDDGSTLTTHGDGSTTATDAPPDHSGDQVDHSGDQVDHSGDQQDHSGDQPQVGNDYGDPNGGGGGGGYDGGGGGGDFA